MPHGLDLEGTGVGGQKNFFSEIQPNLDCELLKWVAHATAQFVCPAPWGPGEGPKAQILLNFNYWVNLKYFKPDFVCLLTNESYKTSYTGFLFGRLGHAPGVVLEVCSGVKI